ncbi:hypothetical protein K438DRAFT_1974443 [Mycena galopus ATCC 62051]|nr:hypothetical protein K438DRAFT_1974443 [Mycena galopus ATCC 62051]
MSDQPDPIPKPHPSRFRIASSRLTDASNSEAPSAAHQLLINNTQARHNGAETILVRIGSIANLVSLLPTTVAEGTEDDEIFRVITTIQGPDGVASTFNRHFDILFKEDVQCRLNDRLHLIRIPEARVIGLWQGVASLIYAGLENTFEDDYILLGGLKLAELEPFKEYRDNYAPQSSSRPAVSIVPTKPKPQLSESRPKNRAPRLSRLSSQQEMSSLTSKLDIDFQMTASPLSVETTDLLGWRHLNRNPFLNLYKLVWLSPSSVFSSGDAI